VRVPLVDLESGPRGRVNMVVETEQMPPPMAPVWLLLPASMTPPSVNP